MTAKSRYKIGKYDGDDKWSWALLKDGYPIMTGMTKREAEYELGQARKKP